MKTSLFVLGFFLTPLLLANGSLKEEQNKELITNFAPWQSGLEKRFWLKVDALCPNSPEFVARAQRVTFRSTLDRKHSYLRSATYLKLRRWSREFIPLQGYLSLYAGRSYSLAETTLCIAAANQDKKWVLLDSALFLDAHVYEAMERKSDPLHVLSVASLEIRQDLFNLAMANYLHELLRRHRNIKQKKQSVRDVLGDSILGQSALTLHKTLLFFESIPAGKEQIVATNFTANILQPRLADQPLYADLSLHKGTIRNLALAQSLFCSFDPHNCQDLNLNFSPPLLFTRDDIEHGQQNLQDYVLTTTDRTQDTLFILGALASNRFHALYELAPNLVENKEFDVVAPLFFLGAAIHFQMQLADARRHAQQGSFFSIGAQSFPSYPEFKTYHFWSEALLGCMHAKSGYSQGQCELDAQMIGNHYRNLMTPAYLAYRVYLGENPWVVFAANKRVLQMHVYGATFGYTLCSKQIEH